MPRKESRRRLAGHGALAALLGLCAAGIVRAPVHAAPAAGERAAAIAPDPAARTDPPRQAAKTRPRLVVLDIELTGDPGTPGIAAQHPQRQRMTTDYLRAKLRASGLYAIVDTAPAQGLIDKLKSEQMYLHDCNGCDLDIGRALHADLVMVSWVDRVSALILSFTYEIDGVANHRIAARKSFDFRGDNDAAWKHTIDFMVNDLKEHAAAQ